MFRIESYVTPIILENVAKYVKNIRPQDFQMSLWEGEVAFANLDLRLDVLEDELNLPFEFLSGHIHNLNIQVPWTKIVSEPIRVIIKTIEFVLKLKDPNKETPGSSSSATSSPQHNQIPKPKRNNRQLDSPQTQQSAGSSLVNKIIQNISIECHNIILKYVEEDIVVSMNVQLLSFGAANEKWQSSMVDVNPVKVLMRKLVRISDLTICLDKRNSAGQIEVCQEPILYRCSLECRILQKYNINTKSTTSKMRIGLFTKSIDLNISALQFPMIMRLVNLAMTLNVSKSKSSISLVDTNEDDNFVVEDDGGEGNVSYLSWAWSLLPSFTFELPYADDQTGAEQPGHMMDVGVYVEELNFTFKNSEILTDNSLGGVKRIRYSSIVRISFGGIYFETVKAEERNWSSMKAGVSNICIEPLGTYKPDDNFPNAFIEGEMLADQNSFIDKSLFDEKSMVSDKGWGITNYEEYMTRTTDEYLLFRSPILAFDFIEYKSPKPQEEEELLTEVTHRELEKHTEYRLLSAGMTFRYNQALLQVINVITEFIKSYDYPAYHAENLDRPNNVNKVTSASKVTNLSKTSITSSQKLHPPIMEDYDALMKHIPLCHHKFSCRSIKIELYPKVTSETVKKSTSASTLTTVTNRKSSDSWKNALPYFLFSIEFIEGSFTTPLDPDKLVHTTCQLPEKPLFLVHACYDVYQLRLDKISLKLINKIGNRNARLIYIPKLHLKFSNLLQPQLWKEDELPKQKVDVTCDQLLLEFSKRESIAAYRLLNCVLQYQSSILWKLTNQMPYPLAREDLIRMQNDFQRIFVKYRAYHNYMVVNVTLRFLQSSFVSLRDVEGTKKIFLSTTSKLHNTHNKWLEIQAQLPNSWNIENSLIPPMIAVWIEPYRFYIDTSSMKFLKYQEDYLTTADREQFELMLQDETTLQATLQTIKSSGSGNAAITALSSKEQSVRKTSRTSASQRKSGNPLETIHLSSERDEKIIRNSVIEQNIKNSDESTLATIKYLKSLIIYIDIANGHISISDSFVQKFAKNEFTDIKLAKVILKSMNTELILRSNLKKKLILNQPNIRETCNWQIKLTDFQIERRTLDDSEHLLKVVHTNITMSLTSKKEKLYKPYIELKGNDFERYSMNNSDGTIENRKNSSFGETGSIAKDTDTIASDDNRDDSFLREMQLAASYEEIPPPVEKKPPPSPDRTTIMLADVITINLHIDTTPIVFLLCSQTVRALYRDMNFVMKLLAQVQLAAAEAAETSDKNVESIKIITAAEEHPDLKSFIEQETQTNNSESSKKEILKPKSTIIFSLLCQCTITKIKFELENNLNPYKNCKMVFEFEDLLISLDKRNEYTKITNKIVQFNTIYYEQLLNNEWKALENLRVKILGETSNLPFLNVTITMVTLDSFFNKIGINQKSEKLTRTLTEILIAMEAIEIICDIDKIINLIQPLCSLFENINTKDQTDENIKKPSEELKTTKISNPITTADMPLIQFDSKGIVFYVPLESVEKRCSATILKIENIKITSNLENPLPRKPIRSDVFSKAAQLGMLNTPGAAIEDRQYELRLRNISASTADWSQVLLLMREQSNNLARLNPAFEWNNPGRSSSSKTFKTRTIFHNFTFLSTFAPCIAYNNILICGQALEFNCVSDFKAELDLYQLCLLSCTSARFSNLSVIIDRICNPRECQPLDITLSSDESSSSFRSLISTDTSFDKVLVRKINEKLPNSFQSLENNNEHNNPTADSGFQSSVSRNLQTTKYKNTSAVGTAPIPTNDHLSTISSTSSILHERFDYTQSTKRHVPFTLSLVAGIFLIKIIKRPLPEPNEEKQKKSVTYPLFMVTISQPSFMYTQNIYDAITQISLFNLIFNVGKYNESGEVDHLMESNEQNERNETNAYEAIIDTRTVRSAITGIPPPLLVIKSHRTKLQLQEIDIEVSKWLIINIKEKCMTSLYRNYLHIFEVLRDNPCLNLCVERPVTRLSKIKLMRQQCLNADRLHFLCDKLTLNFTDGINYNCKLVLAEAKAHITFLMRPEKAAIKLGVGSCYLQTDNKIFVHPIAIRVSADFISEPWYSLPLVTVIVKFGVVRVDFGITVVLQLRESMKGVNRILESMENDWKKLIEKRPVNKIVTPKERLVHLKCVQSNCNENVNVKQKKIKTQREEFYQDDLRAGAFQFVELKSESFLPLPYQIQIVKKNYGIICWRYPQPRRMCKIQVYPVPMAINNPVQIKCCMEYFSEVHEGFQHYCDFTLSETISKVIKLPQREICANIWRVIIMQSFVSVNGECFENSDEEYELQSISSQKIDETINVAQAKSDFILHPKILVGCMRIDTSFQSKCVPTIQFLITCPLFKVLLLNQPNQNGELPMMFKKFRLTQLTTISQTIFKMCIENINLHASIFSSSDIVLENNFEFQIKYLDQGFLNMLYFIEKMKVQNVINLKKSPSNLTINTIIDRLRINIGPTLMNSLFSMKFHWEEFLSTKVENLNNLHAVIPKFLIVNRTYTAVSFGQTGTTERIHLQRKECHLYSFYSDYHNQELTFFITDEETKITEASQSVGIVLKFEGKTMLQHIRIGNKCIIIKSIRLSATQIAILVKGQIEFISMVPHELRLEFRRDSKSVDEKNIGKEEYEIEVRGRYCFYKTVHRKSNIFMRIKSLSSGKGRSGDIPLRTNKHLPWLVKVPVQNFDFVSFWVRILREDIAEFSNDSFQPQKVLITIWPIYIISSMLTSPTNCVESYTGKKFSLGAAGARHILDVPATHLSEHTVNFQLNYPVGEKSMKNYSLSLKNLDWNNFFCYDESLWTIEYSLKELSKGIPSDFPNSDPEEARIARKSNEPQKIDVFYKLSPSREFSCSQNLEISPWGLFINATNETIKICDNESDNNIVVSSNGIGMLFAIEHAFKVNIQNGSHWIPSLPIYIKKDGDFITCKIKHYSISESMNSIDILLLRPDEVLKFVLDYTIENRRRILKLRSKFAIANFTKLNLFLLPFAIDHKETIECEDVKNLDFKFTKTDLYPTRGTENCIGHYCNSFFDLNTKGILRSNDTAFIYFVCFKISEQSDISIPIPLSIPFARRCFSIQNDKDSVPLVVTLLEKDNVFYLNVFEDVAPAILVKNQTNVEFIIAQTCSTENSEVTTIGSEYIGRHFDWLQYLNAFSKCYYTPPELYMNFPDVDSIICNLTIALKKDGIKKKDIIWSKAISTSQTWQKYLHVPCHGDVRVSICDKHRTVQICISYISQQSEFSAKEIRSRLQLPTNIYKVSTRDSSSISSKHSSCSSEETSGRVTAKCAHFSQECEVEKQECTARLLIKEIIISLNTDCKDRDFMKKEILNWYIDDLMVAFDDLNDNRTLNILMGNMQIDNQSHSTGKFDFPVVLCAEELYKCNTNTAQVHFLDLTYHELHRNKPMVLFKFDFFVDEFSLNSVCCHLSPIRVYIEDNYITELLDALIEIDPSNCAHRPENVVEPLALSQGLLLLPKDIVTQAICLAEPLRLRSFKIEPLSISLSVHTSVRLYIALDHSPLSFSTYERRHILTIPMRLGQSLGMHYLSGAIFGAGWVVGSLEILGSPSGLARSFSTGFRDFVSLPVQGLFRGPWGFIVGITHGSASLLRNVTAGTVNSFTKFASSVARNLDRLSLDSEHIERTDALRRSRPSGFTDGVSKGLTGLGISILGAVGGLAHHSLEASSSVGVVTGFGKGIVGAFTKPLGGAVELVALAGQGMLQSVGFNAMPQQRAPSAIRNVSSEPSSYRIWKLLPGVLATDQILVYQEASLMVQKQMRRGYVLLTSAVFVLMEAQWDKLTFICPIDKVQIIKDRGDKNLFHVSKVKKTDDIEEDLNYTNQRIMHFLHSSCSKRNQHVMTSDSLNDLLMTKSKTEQGHMNVDCSFYVKEHIGEHIIQYLKVMLNS